MAEVLFINGQSDHKWIESLRETVHNLGKSLLLVDHRQLQDKLQNCELVIVDAGAIDHDDLTSVVKLVHSSNSRIRIVVVSSAPHWKEARRMLLIGVTDYVRKVDDEKVILNILRGNISTLLRQNNVPKV